MSHLRSVVWQVLIKTLSSSDLTMFQYLYIGLHKCNSLCVCTFLYFLVFLEINYKWLSK